MATVVNFRPFKVPKPEETQFFKFDDSENIKFMESDLAASGLLPEDMLAYTSAFVKKEGALAAYGIPYFDPKGQPIVNTAGELVMFRTRFKYPPFSKAQRYTQPSKEQLAKYGLPSYVPYINPLTLSLEGEYLVCCEGEKKTGAVLKHLELPAFGIGGCQMWRDPNSGSGIHPWIRELLESRGLRKILIVPDGDLYRYDICSAYGTFAHTLRAEGYDVEIVNPSGKIDDLIVSWGATAKEAFSVLPRVNPEDLVQSPVSLAKRYNLAFKQDAKGSVTVLQHTSNVMTLLEEHTAFPRVWRNEDNNRLMIGDRQMQPGLSEMELANYFQHNLGFDRVNSRIMMSCLEALGKKNARSPFLEYVKAQVWDGTPRLESWLTRHWGVEDSSFTREVGLKWFVSACARMDRPGSKVDWMLIVIGPQATGKTSMPGIVFKGLNLTLYGEHNDKDLHMLLHSSLCVGFDELDSFGKRESSNLKAMITRNEDAFRPPYGSSVEIFPRRFTLYGCGNRHEFLQQDPSGYRRYAVVEVTRLLDFAGLEAERDQLWAEAWTLYTRGGIKFWEVEGASQRAEQYVIQNPMEAALIDKVDAWIKQRPEGMVYKGSLYITFSDLLIALGIEATRGNTSQAREIGAMMAARYGPAKNTTGPKGQKKYYIIPL